MVKFTTTNIVGTPDTKTWSQAQSVARGDDQVMVVVQLTCDDDNSLVDLATLGSEILAEIEREGQEGVTAIVEGMKEGLKIEILVATVRGLHLSFKGVGGVEVYLARNGQLAKLGQSGEGELKENDVVVLTTDKFVEAVSLAKMKEILTQEEEPAELLIPLFHTQTETSGVGAIVGVVKPEKVVTKWPQINLRREGGARRINLWIGGVILLLLIMMIGVGMVRRVKVNSERDFVSLSSSVAAKVEETLSVGDLNPERARILLTQARGEVEAYLGSDIRIEYKQKAEKLLTEIDSADERAFKKNDTKLSTVVELTILAEGLTAPKMKSDGKGNLIFMDTTNQRLVAMKLSDRSRQIIEPEQSEKFVDIGVNEAKVYGLNRSGVTELFWKKTETKKVIEPDEFWKDPTQIELFAGNVYVFDKEQSEIWKYPVLTDSFGSRRRWLAAGITPDLSNVVDMKVVGDVWLLTSTGKLERYSRGAPVAFPMDGFPAKGEGKKLSEPSAVWVSESLVYVLENGASRVVVLGAEGKYQSQYVNSEFAKASDLVVVDDKGYVLIDNVVKEFGL